MSDGAGQFDVGHLDAAALERYRRRTAPPSELLQADAHIAACTRCFEAVRAQDDTIELPAAGDQHLSYEELESFVDGRADAVDRELLTAHTSHCALCSDELADVTATRDALAPRPPRTPSPMSRRLPR